MRSNKKYQFKSIRWKIISFNGNEILRQDEALFQFKRLISIFKANNLPSQFSNHFQKIKIMKSKNFNNSSIENKIILMQRNLLSYIGLH